MPHPSDTPETIGEKLRQIVEARPVDSSDVSEQGRLPAIPIELYSPRPATNYDLSDEYVSDEQWGNS